MGIVIQQSTQHSIPVYHLDVFPNKFSLDALFIHLILCRDMPSISWKNKSLPNLFILLYEPYLVSVLFYASRYFVLTWSHTRLIFRMNTTEDQGLGSIQVQIPSLSSSFQSIAAAAKSLQSYPTLWDPIDSSPPGSPVPGILQARTLEWVAISFSNTWK